MTKEIKYIFADIDGVLTDGKVWIDAQGNENKPICYRDLDSIAIGRKAGLEFVFVTGENTALAREIARRFKVEPAVFGAKDKLSAIKNLIDTMKIDKECICYIGDSDRDASAIGYVGLGIAPKDGSKKAREAADFISDSVGGSGVLFEVVENIIEGIVYRRD
ncbi:MAG: gmhA [Firmicutes bacterium]|nr:gmhA [Bacillota bacterium]